MVPVSRAYSQSPRSNWLNKSHWCLLLFVTMNKDDEDEYPTSSEDAFYEADYDEDTIDYDLDAEEFLEDEEFEPEPTARRDIR